MIALLLAVQVAQAEPAVGAVMEPEDVVEQYREQAAAAGKSASEQVLLCKPATEGLQVCASVISESGWRYATHADETVKSPTEKLSGNSLGFKEKKVEDIGAYWVRELNDGREGLVFVQPAVMSSFLPEGTVVAWPVPGVVIAWVPGNPRLDQILSVGIAKMVEASNHPISSKLYRFTEDEWVVWGEAKKPQSP